MKAKICPDYFNGPPGSTMDSKKWLEKELKKYDCFLKETDDAGLELWCNYIPEKAGDPILPYFGWFRDDKWLSKHSEDDRSNRSHFIQ